MLDQLVESRSNSGENTREAGFLLVTMVIVGSLFFGAIIWSLFSKDITGNNGEDLELSTLVAPVPLPEDKPPPPPEPENKPEKTVTEKQDVTVVKEAFASVENTKVPPKDTLGKNDVMSVKAGEKFTIGDRNVRASTGDSGISRGDGGGGGIQTASTPAPKEEEDAPPPTPKPKPTETPKPVPKTVSGGVVNGKATNLVKPPYPPAARAVRAAGTVNVQVTIDERGNVISASAVSGHPLLKAAAEQAARASKFSPTQLSGQAVKVTGVIVYNFTAQ